MAVWLPADENFRLWGGSVRLGMAEVASPWIIKSRIFYLLLPLTRDVKLASKARGGNGTWDAVVVLETIFRRSQNVRFTKKTDMDKSIPPSHPRRALRGRSDIDPPSPPPPTAGLFPMTTRPPKLGTEPSWNRSRADGKVGEISGSPAQSASRPLLLNLVGRGDLPTSGIAEHGSCSGRYSAARRLLGPEPPG